MGILENINLAQDFRRMMDDALVGGHSGITIEIGYRNDVIINVPRMSWDRSPSMEVIITLFPRFFEVSSVADDDIYMQRGGQFPLPASVGELDKRVREALKKPIKP